MQPGAVGGSGAVVSAVLPNGSRSCASFGTAHGAPFESGTVTLAVTWKLPPATMSALGQVQLRTCDGPPVHMNGVSTETTPFM